MATTITTSNEHFLIRNRNLRNELLKKTDYYMLNDVYEILSDIQKQEIKQYRQTLRDFINEIKANISMKENGIFLFPKFLIG